MNPSSSVRKLAGVVYNPDRLVLALAVIDLLF
jgi:hypothetical protein